MVISYGGVFLFNIPLLHLYNVLKDLVVFSKDDLRIFTVQIPTNVEYFPIFIGPIPTYIEYMSK
jgi:hypothetical protein